MTTMTQYQNLLTLRDDVFPVVFEKEKEGLVYLDLVDCGSKHCLWGWAKARSYIPITSTLVVDAEIIYGISKDQRDGLFGASDKGGTLKDRYKYLCNLIKEKEKELGINDKPLPNWQAMSQIPQAERLEAEVV